MMKTLTLKLLFMSNLLMGSAFGMGQFQWNETWAPESLATSIKDGPYVQPGGRLGHWGVGNGGDYLRIGFARARDHSANIVKRLSPSALRYIEDETVRGWLQAHKNLLAADILATQHIWEAEGQSTCAWTVMPSGSEPIPTANPLQLSYPTCRDKIKSFYEASQLIIHESVHHFAEGEDLADKIAIAVVDAWRNGRIEWLSMSNEQAPSARQKHSAVWNGEAMVVFGGYDSQEKSSLGDGHLYHPNEDRWEAVEELSQLSPRHQHSAHWTGNSMIVWGGYFQDGQSASWQYNGFIWNPETKTVKKIQTPSWWQPKPFTWTFDPRQQTVWTGSELVVLGGVDENGKQLAAKYEPNANRWLPLSQKEAPILPKIAGHSLIWTGDSLIVWGGYEGRSNSARSLSNSGAIFHLEAQIWSVMSGGGQPSKRAGQTAVWTGTQMIVISGGGVGSQRDLKGTGGLYNPKSDAWVELTMEMLFERVGHSAIWNGHELLVYGGRSNRLRTYLGEVFNFDPDGLRWSGVNSRFTPSSRWYHSAIWTGSSLIIWGGNQGTKGDLHDGGVFFP